MRVPGGMLISPTGTTPERIDEAGVVEMALDVGAPGASSEWPLHGAIYAARPEIGAVVHTHSDACTALACLNEGLPAFHYGVLAFGGAVRCAPYVTFGTPALATLAVAALEGRTACLLGNHGMIVAGATLAGAAEGAAELERLARQYLLARSAGVPRLLDEAEVADAMVRLQTYHRGAP